MGVQKFGWRSATEKIRDRNLCRKMHSGAILRSAPHVEGTLYPPTAHLAIDSAFKSIYGREQKSIEHQTMYL